MMALSFEASPLLEKENEKTSSEITKSQERSVYLKRFAVVATISMVIGIVYTLRSQNPVATSSAANLDTPQQTPNSTDTESYFRCPPGSYLNSTDESRAVKNARLRDVVMKLFAKGWVVNPDENYKAEYMTRGYATFESPIWPGPEECLTLPDELWSNENNAHYYHYQPDHAPSGMLKQRYTDYPFEFHENYKVASTSFSAYLPDEYGVHEHVNENEFVPDGWLVASAVRHPISRFVSAVEELMQRSINHYCPEGYCNSLGWTNSSFNNQTLWKLSHQTTWYPKMCNVTDMKYDSTLKRWVTDPACSFDKADLPEIITAFVEDDKCKYYYYASQHFSSQSAFVTQNNGNAHDIDTIIQLEDLTNGLIQLGEKVGHVANTSFPWLNSNDEKPLGIPTEDMIHAVLDKIPTLTQDLCWVYAQDFICYEYDLPDACVGLF